MPTVIPVGYAQAVLSFSYSTDVEPMAVTFGVKVDPLLTPPEANQIAGAINAQWDATVQPLVSVDVTHLHTDVRWQFDALPAPPVEGTNPSGTVGGAAGALIPQNTAYLVHKRTSVAGRSGRGRLYIPGVQEGNVSTVGRVADATVSAWNVALQTFLEDVKVTGIIDELVILHSTPGAYALDTPAVITSLTMDPVVATQRRRLRP